MRVATENPATGEDHAAFLSKRQVLELIPISATSLWDWCRNGHFPKPRTIGSKTVWLSSDVHAWMQARPVREYKKPQEIGSKSWQYIEWTPETGCSHQSPPCTKKGG
jgi:predicted DNA-binding transcriptional regulator AlpA